MQTKTTAGATVLAVLLLALAAAGDTLYMRDGRTLVGKVLRTADGKITVKMAHGTIDVPEADVIYVARGPVASAPAPSPGDTDPTKVKVRLKPRATWNVNETTLPEPIVFMQARQLELIGPDPAAEIIRRQLAQWRIVAHEGKRKCGSAWLTRDDQRRRRAAYEEKSREAARLIVRGKYLTARTPEQKAQKQKMRQEAIRAMVDAVKAWPDLRMRDFLAATVDLEADAYTKAELRFRRCIDAQPLVAAFHQGRGMALMGMKHPLRALAEFVACLQLRDDDAEAAYLVEDAMKDVPGAKVSDPIYVRAKDLLARYDMRKRTATTTRSVAWLLPGRIRRIYNNAMVTPEYDRIVCRQALAIPVTANGALLADRNALDGALQVYLEAPDGSFLPAEAVRGYSYTKSDLPLRAVQVFGATFTPIDMERPAACKPGQTVTIQAVNLYRQMGTAIRTGEAKVKAVSDAGATFTETLLPGEAVGAVFAGQDFAGFLSARTDPAAKGCGASTMVNPKDLAELMKRTKRSLESRSRYRRYGSLTLKKDAKPKPIEGRTFRLHILAGEKPPKPQRK